MIDSEESGEYRRNQNKFSHLAFPFVAGFGLWARELTSFRARVGPARTFIGPPQGACEAVG